MGPGPISIRPGPAPPLSEAPAAPQQGGSGRQPPHGALGQRAVGSMFSPDGGLPAAPFGLLTDAGPPFSRGSFDGAPAQPLFFPFAATAEPEPARDLPPARAWLPPPAPAPPAKAEARPGRPCSQPEPEPRTTACCGPAWPPPPWAGPAPSGPTALPGPPFSGPAAPAFPGPQLCPAALQPGSGGPSGLGSSGSSSGAASEGGHSSDSGEEVRSDGTGMGRAALPSSHRSPHGVSLGLSYPFGAAVRRPVGRSCPAALVYRRAPAGAACPASPSGAPGRSPDPALVLVPHVSDSPQRGESLGEAALG